MSAYAVCVTDPLAPPLAALPFLSGRPGFNKDSARVFLRKQPGFLGRGLDFKTAGELKAAAAAAGLETAVIDEASLVPPPPPVRPLKLELTANGFTAFSAATKDFHPFESVSLICAGAYDAPVAPLNLEGAKLGLLDELREKFFGPPPKYTHGPRKETFFRADVLAGGVRLRLEPEKLDFSALGPERAQSSLQNFRLQLGRLAAPCFRAVKNSFLAAFLKSEQLAPYKLASDEACEAELSRLLLLQPRA